MVIARARWAIDVIRVQPHHHLLEVGCGRGTAVAMVCARLTTGRILAIDRSATAVARATQRNAAYIAQGLARIEQVDLSDLRVPDRSFHTIFALNVNILQTTAETGLIKLIRGALRPAGRFVLCYEQPSAPRLAERAERVSHHLSAEGLATTVDWAGPSRVCVTATLTR